MDIKGTDLALLVSLDVLIEEANVTRAASRLHLSQPALSAQLSRLRDIFDDPLLVPAEKGRGMTLTARAQQMQKPLHEALLQLGKVVRESGDFQPETAERTFNIVANDNVVVMLGLGLMQKIKQAGGKNLKLAFRTMPREQLVAQMERGEIDLMLGGARFIPDTLKSRPLLTDRYRVAQRKGHPRGTQAIDIDGYCAERHMMISTDGSFYGLMDDQLEKLGKTRTVALSVPQYNLAPPVLASTDYLCTLPSRFLARFEDQLDHFPVPFEIPDFSISMAWHPRSENDPGHRWLRGQLMTESPGTV